MKCVGAAPRHGLRPLARRARLRWRAGISQRCQVGRRLAPRYFNLHGSEPRAARLKIPDRRYEQADESGVPEKRSHERMERPVRANVGIAKVIRHLTVFGGLAFGEKGAQAFA